MGNTSLDVAAWSPATSLGRGGMESSDIGGRDNGSGVMGAVQIVSTVLAAAITGVAIWLVVRAVMKMFAVVRLGQPDPERFDRKPMRTRTMLVETLGHTKMLKWTWIGSAHWLVMVSFILLSKWR